jgi:amino-acid N-acetyltransferase
VPVLRTAVRADARRIHDLIQRNQQAGHLLPREMSELVARIDRFVVGVDGRGAIIACGELAPLSASLAEIRSLVVGETRRGQGLGHRIVDELRVRAQAAGYSDLCVFAHQPAYFAHMGFSIVPHTWLPEKITADCRTCPLFRKCEQFAMVMDLDVSPELHANAQLHV